MYNVMSPKAEEFISHEEILESLSYAEKNKNNRELIDEILTKAREKKGISHRFLRKPYRYVCAAVSVKLLRQWLRILPIPCQE